MTKENKKSIVIDGQLKNELYENNEILKRIVRKLENGTLSFEEYILTEYSTVDRFSKMLEYSSDTEKLCDTFIDYFRDFYSFVSINRLKTLFNRQSTKLLGEKMKDTLFIMTSDKTKRVEFASIWLKIEQRFENDYRINSKVRIQRFGDIEYTDELVDKVLDFMKRNDIFLCEPHVEDLLKMASTGQINIDETYLKPAREEELIKPVIKKIDRIL